MAQQQTGTVDRSDLDVLALAFVVQVQGRWTQDAVDTWQTELKRHGLTPSAAQLDAALARAREQFETGAAHLFLCMGKPCRQRQKFDASEEALQRVAAGAYHLTTTECQGPCKQAPVATLRV
ncbi:MAG: (2Fe-2S) ferredoxin domain-containing protein, partial [Candidatus Tectomicrobia bacterium]|nr:(2Fe-2S) ferredoxin domain-containing protein [Candidatus Tectomicrobia bacterium]